MSESSLFFCHSQHDIRLTGVHWWLTFLLSRYQVWQNWGSAPLQQPHAEANCHSPQLESFTLHWITFLCEDWTSASGCKHCSCWLCSGFVLNVVLSSGLLFGRYYNNHSHSHSSISSVSLKLTLNQSGCLWSVEEPIPTENLDRQRRNSTGKESFFPDPGHNRHRRDESVYVYLCVCVCVRGVQWYITLKIKMVIIACQLRKLTSEPCTLPLWHQLALTGSGEWRLLWIMNVSGCNARLHHWQSLSSPQTAYHYNIN